MRRLACAVAAVLFFGVASTAVAGTGAHLTWVPTSHNFGSQLAGTASGDFPFQLKNDGTVQTTGPITFSQGGASAQFTIDTSGCPSTLAAGAVCLVHTQFTPGAAAMGLYKATLKASATPGGGPQINLSGTATNAHLTISPASYNYGETVVGGNSADQVFLVRNDGNLPSGPVSFGTSGGDAAMFVDNGSTCGPSLAKAGDPGDTCTLIYRFHPTAKGNRKTTLSASSAPGGKATSALSGTGTLAHLTISPTSWNFGSANIGSSSSPQTFTVVNNGTATTGTLHVTFAGNNPGDFSPPTGGNCEGATLTVGFSCTVTLQFTAGAFGNRSAKLIVGESTGPVTVQAGLSGRGVGAHIVVTPTSKNFGSVNYGQGASSAPQTFTVKNTGDGPTSGTISGFVSGDQGDFPLSNIGGSCFAPLPPGGTCALQFTFTPTTTGTRAATLNLSAGPGEGTPTAAFTGKGTLAALSVSPTDNDFGNVNYGNAESSGPQTFTVTNNGDGASGPVSDVINGSGDFAISSDTCSGNPVAANGGTCTFVVTYTPSAAGAAGATTVDVSTAFPLELAPSATLEGFGQLAVLALDATSDSGDFGNSVSGTASQTIVVTNTGDVQSGQLTVSVDGPDATDFTVPGGPDACSTVTLGTGGDTCSFEVDFTPSGPNPESATAHVSSTAPNEATLDIPLSGTST